MPEMRRTIKDSVFTFLFKQPEYTRQLYLTLHPEDTGVTEEDCKIITLENVLTTGLYNDLGIQVRDRLILLVEAQSTFSVNIALRFLLYLAATYKVYVEEHKLDLYGTRPVAIPRPELYVIYTGTRRDIPEKLYLSNLYNGSGHAEVQVEVLRGTGTEDIIGQYVRFCRIADENRRQYGLTQKAIEGTIHQCLDEHILVPFLTSRQKEVQDIMVTLFDQQTISEIHDYNVAKEARQEGWQKGIAEERENSIRRLVYLCRRLASTPETAAKEIAEQFDIPLQLAAEKVDLYWEQ